MNHVGWTIEEECRDGKTLRLRSPAGHVKRVTFEGTANDDSREPITAEWWLELIGKPHKDLEAGMFLSWPPGAVRPFLNYANGAGIHTRYPLLNCKTRGDFRKLCELLGVELK